ncbi:MAG: hypothetical protein EOP49_01855 [Sphingobacteriales bacterium]|nr:MAG: hypothetical protein EOP49_01855 [Sphingobacteriales bacterium]
MKNYPGLLIAVLFSTVLFIACKKEAGPGGLASIKGKVFATDVTASGTERDSNYIGDHRVYISVSGNSSHFDDVRTSYDGTYKFSSLRKGSYDVWTFGECDTCVWTQKKVMLTGVEISEKKQEVELPDLRIIL